MRAPSNSRHTQSAGLANLHLSSITGNTDNARLVILMVGAVNKSEKMTRTSVTIPSSLKKEMNKIDVNWSAVVREAVRQRLDYESERDISEALPLNERLRRKAPEGWDSTRVIRLWRSKRS